MRKIFGSWKENTAIIIGAALVACGVFYVVKNPDLFMASVLSLQEKAFIAEKGRDIAYKTNSGAVDIFMSEKLETPASIDFTISFDKDKITIQPQELSGQGTFTISRQDANDIIIQSIPGQTIDKSQSLVILPFQGDQEGILLSEATADGKGLSIGSLNEITSHSQ